ncbi:XrtB/PEP-CTERM-associated transcriptional regulator EpsA [Roseateles koreensis]|uniref:Helix-turn-helix transcriptional regulator n=1 Tax=Roseateles koreensis TaxID=2987526 RepID=A0ABT5KMA8_9BURK|nr:XrtB/PEP-CTERM-associated transcriptional regulator EpsA [Roseateles koreensis]MDC8784052.1 helix-turn-helix transcriptional regulator [Roseateles koreensis]
MHALPDQEEPLGLRCTAVQGPVVKPIEDVIVQALGAAAALPRIVPGPINADQVDAMVRAVEASLEVRRRYQFFVWSQSNLQALLPHQLAICGAYARQRRELEFEAFNSVSVPPDLLVSLTDGRSALMQQLQGRWIDARCKPCAVSVESLQGQALQATRVDLLAAGFVELLVHGVSRPQRPTEIESFFILSSHDRVATQPQRLMMELLMPYLHGTWLRVQSVERDINESPRPMGARLPQGSAVTEREREILSWLREGMSNQQIGEQLGISALTVKNHVQKILRKLGAANRAQAVARAMSMNLLGRFNAESGREGR